MSRCTAAERRGARQVIAFSDERTSKRFGRYFKGFPMVICTRMLMDEAGRMVPAPRISRRPAPPDLRAAQQAARTLAAAGGLCSKRDFLGTPTLSPTVRQLRNG